MSGDKIYMDYLSKLGPIDPQIQTNNGERLVPALSYLRQFERLVEKSKKEMLTAPELALLSKLDLAELHKLELASKLSVSLIEGWLTEYKFKDWSQNGNEVSLDKKKQRAREIAEKLNDHEKWYTHGNSIHKDILEKDIGLRIDDYSEEKNLKKTVWDYFWSMLEYANRYNYASFIQSRGFV